jgi:hypothetical protein
MNGGNRVVGLWPDRKPDVDAEALAHVPEVSAADPIGADYTIDEYDEPAPRERWRTVVAILCVLTAIGWIGFVGWAHYAAWRVAAPAVAEISSAIAMACAPLALIALVYVIVTRSRRADANQFERTAASMRAEQHRLEATLAHVEARILASKVTIAETSDALMSLGEDTASRMHNVAESMRHEVDTISTNAQSLRSSAASARADVAVLLADLPKAHSESRKMVTSLEAAGLTAHEAAGRLDAQLAALSARGREADEIAGGAAQKLAAHLSRVESVSSTAGERLTEASAQMTGAVDAALDHAARASDAARQGLEAQGAAMMALVDQAQAALARTGADSAQAIATRIDDAHNRVEAMGALLATQSETTAKLLDVLRAGLTQVDGQFAAIDDASEARHARLTSTLSALTEHATGLTGAFERGTGTADLLIGRTEKLMTALDATTREIDETLPAAFARIDARATSSQAIIANSGSDIAQMETAASAALDRLMEAEAMLAKQRAGFDDFAATSETRLVASGDALRSFTSEIATADAAARSLAEGAGAQLIEALLRVRETAQTAAERAREAIARIIPEATETLSLAARDALTKALSDQVGSHIAELSATAEHALSAANTASDQLTRQMLTIADTSAAIELRIAEAKADAQTSDRDNFARRVALLIESLNSTAIDVTKVLSNEVTDSAWAAYLRGDRGVFTRRAVRLLDTGEAREIVRHYDAEPEFREQVNRYIHDFEAMLRNTLSTRDGSALSVTLLSSDMGKLYVALAQAIERLRS